MEKIVNIVTGRHMTTSG